MTSDPNQANNNNKKNNNKQSNTALHPIPPKPELCAEVCQESRDILQSDLLCAMVRRNKNDNRICYRARLLADGKTLDPKQPLEAFWLKIEPSYVKKNRKNGKKDDKTELTYLESTMAYGMSFKAIENKPNEYKIVFVALSKENVTLKIDPTDQIPRCFVIHKADELDPNTYECVLKEIYVKAKESWIGLPTVEYLLLSGYNHSNGDPMTHKMYD